MSLLSRVRVFAKKPPSVVLESFSGAGSGRFFAVVLYGRLYLCCRLKENIKFFNLYYIQFTPKLRFIYSVKRLFAYCFNKAPTLYLGFFINSPPWAFREFPKYLVDFLSQALNKITLALFCCAYRQKGGVV